MKAERIWTQLLWGVSVKESAVAINEALFFATGDLAGELAYELLLSDIPFNLDGEV
jgi:hypothetical protein